MLVALLSLIWFFRFQVVTGFQTHFGDRHDGLIEIAILQHWGNVLSGAAHWDTVFWFYPHPATLGYNAGHLLTGVLFAGGRAAGLSMTMAVEGAHAALKLVGFLGMAALLRGPAQVRGGWALFGAALFTTADMTLQHANHGQLFTLGLAPSAALLAWRFVHQALAGHRPLGSGLALTALFALWVSTAFYLAWFFALFTFLAMAVALCRSGRTGIARASGAVAAHRTAFAAVASTAVVTLLPFLSVYLPKARETGGHDYIHVRDFLPPPLELANAGPANLLWAGATDRLRQIAPYLTTDRDFVFGLTPVLLGLALVAVARLQRDLERPALAAVAVAVALSWLLMMNLGDASPWRLIHAVVPGASGVRVVGRFALFLLVPTVAIVTVLLDRSHRPRLAVALAALLLAEQVAVTAPLDLPEDEVAGLLAGLPSPPARCRSFYAVSTRARAVGSPGIDAMILAEHFRLPTVNGYSTFNPPGWDFTRAAAPDYRVRVQRYLDRFGLTGVCELDRARGRIWIQVN